MGWESNSVFQVVIVTGTAGSGVFVYSPAPGPGKLVASIAAAGGTDPFGNAYFAGVTSYFISGVSLAVSLAAGQITYFSSTTGAAGPWSAGTVLSASQGAGGLASVFHISPQGLVANAVTNILGALNVNGGLLDAINGLQVSGGSTVAGGEAITGGLTADTALVNSGQAAGGLLKVNNATAGASNALAWLTVAAIPDAWGRMRVSGDSANRIGFDWTATNNNPRMHFGSGSAAPDTTIYRAAANLFGSDYIAYDAGNGLAEVWNAVTFANGWANAATGAGLQFRRVAAPASAVEMIGRITAPVGIAVNQAIIVAMPTGYRPVNIQDVVAANLTTPGIVRLQVGTGGVLTYQSGAVAGDVIGIPGGTLIALTA